MPSTWYDWAFLGFLLGVWTWLFWKRVPQTLFRQLERDLPGILDDFASRLRERTGQPPDWDVERRRMARTRGKV
jgi:hypothetical protein